MRVVPLNVGDTYHVFNRGANKGVIFKHQKDLYRFREAMWKLNTVDKVGHLSRLTRRRFPESTDETKPLVKIVAYNLNPNHFHMILEQLEERGIERFINRICISHSKYFNLKHERKGTLFEGRFKSILVDSNDYLLHLSVYVNLNNLAHSRGNRNTFSLSSWNEYMGLEEGICEKRVILEQFPGVNKYKKFAEKTIKDIIERKILLSDNALEPNVDSRNRH